MSSWVLRVPEIDAYKKPTQFTAVALRPPDHKVLLVSAEDTKAAFHLLETRVDDLLNDKLDPCSELHHPLS